MLASRVLYWILIFMGKIALLLQLNIGVVYVVLMSGRRLRRTTTRFLQCIKFLVEVRLDVMPVVWNGTTPSSATWRLVLDECRALWTSSPTPVRRRLQRWHRCSTRLDRGAITSFALVLQFFYSFRGSFEILLKQSSVLLYLDVIPSWEFPRRLLSPKEAL